MGFFDFLKPKKETPDPIEDWTKLFPKEIADGLLNEIKSNSQAGTSDEIPQGIGEFGLEKTNPIPTYGIPSNKAYLQSLRTLNGEVLRFRRTGSIEVENINNRVDEYEIFNPKGDTVAFIYISSYHWKTSTNAPVGFYIKGRKKETYAPAIHPRENFIPQSAYKEFQLAQKKKQKETETATKKKTSLFRDNSQEYMQILKSNKIDRLYHFTDKRNLQSIIKNGGLFSWYYCLENEIEISVPGGNQLSRELDSNKGLQNYVRVSFTRNHPMMFAEHNRHKQNVILEIDPKIISFKNSLYANKNATRNDVNVGGSLDDLNRLRFDFFKQPNHFNLSESDKPYYQGEILIETTIPLEYILNINELI